MASPFPGMDPYLEDSSIRSGFHHKLATEIDADTESQIVYKPEPNSGLRIIRPDISVGQIDFNGNGNGVSKNGEPNPSTNYSKVASYLRKRRVILNSETL